MVNFSHAVVVNFSNMHECSITTEIYNPKIDIIDGTLIIYNHSDDTEDNEIQLNLNNFEFKKYNSNKDMLVLDSRMNWR